MLEHSRLRSKQSRQAVWASDGLGIGSTALSSQPDTTSGNLRSEIEPLPSPSLPPRTTSGASLRIRDSTWLTSTRALCLPDAPRHDRLSYYEIRPRTTLLPIP